jgi:hypothetical protein
MMFYIDKINTAINKRSIELVTGENKAKNREKSGI